MSKMVLKLTTSFSLYSSHSKNSYSIDDSLGCFYTKYNRNNILKQAKNTNDSSNNKAKNSETNSKWNMISIKSSSNNSHLSLNSSTIQIRNKDKDRDRDSIVHKRQNRSIEVSQRVKTSNTENIELVLEMKREKYKRQQELYEATQRKKQIRNQIIKNSKEKIKNKITEKACLSKKQRLETEGIIQVNKRKRFMLIKGMHDDIHCYRVNNKIKNRKELIAQKDKIKQMLFEKIMNEEQVNKQFKNKINEYNKIIVNRIKVNGINNVK